MALHGLVRGLIFSFICPRKPKCHLLCRWARVPEAALPKPPVPWLWNKHPRAAGSSRDGLGEMSLGLGSLAATRTDDTALADSFFTPSPSHTPGCVKQPSRRRQGVLVLISGRPRRASAAPWQDFCLRPATWGPGPRPVGACASSFVFAALLAPKVLRLRTLAEDFHMVCLGPLQTDEAARTPAAHRRQCSSHGIIAALWVKGLAGASQEIHPYPVRPYAVLRPHCLCRSTGCVAHVKVRPWPV